MGKGTPLPPDIEKGSKRPGGHNHPLPPPPRQPPPQPWFPWLVPVIFFVDVGLFIYSMYLNDCPSRLGDENCIFSHDLGRFAFEPFNENPLLGPSVNTLKELGGLEKALVVEKHESWRLVTCIWLHAGILHLGANMLSLLVVGIGLEQEFGWFKIGVLYVVSGIGGSLLSAIMDNELHISVGASGSLFGLLGGMLSELLTNWTIYVNKCAALSTLIVVVGLNLAMGHYIPNVDNSAHVGGFTAGFLLGFILLIRPQYGYVSRRYIPAGYDMKRYKSKYQCYQSILWVLALVLIVAGFASGLGELFDVEKVEDISL